VKGATETMKILVVGAGATGGYFGARLAQAGRDVTFLVRQRRAEQLRQRGLRIVGPGANSDESQVVTPSLVTADQLIGTADVVLVSVKATALEPALTDFAPAVGPQTAVVPFLNGMGHLATLTKRFGEPAVLGGVVVVMSQLNDAGDIVKLAPPASMTIGAQDGRHSQRLDVAGDELGDAGFEFAVSDEIVAQMWAKWVFIATIAALTGLMRGTVGDIVAVPGGRDLGPAILAETSAVAAAAGYPVPEARLASIRQTVTQDGSPVTASLSRDVSEGRPAEVEPMLGDLARRGAELGVATPLLDLASMNLRIYNNKLT
jgi:2-dehydropantoate 2-reductase